MIELFQNAVENYKQQLQNETKKNVVLSELQYVIELYEERLNRLKAHSQDDQATEQVYHEKKALETLLNEHSRY
jgi:predicted component of type VI protein secretion system